MALNMFGMWFKGIEIPFFPKKITKIAQQLGASPPDPQSIQPLGPRHQTSRLWYIWVTLAFSKRLQSYIFALFNYISLSSLPLQNRGLMPTGKFSANKFSAYKLESVWKKFWRPFFLDNTCGCVVGPCARAFVSLASRGSVLEKAVLGLGFFCILGLELCVLDSTSALVYRHITPKQASSAYTACLWTKAQKTQFVLTRVEIIRNLNKLNYSWSEIGRLKMKKWSAILVVEFTKWRR